MLLAVPQSCAPLMASVENSPIAPCARLVIRVPPVRPPSEETSPSSVMRSFGSPIAPSYLTARSSNSPTVSSIASIAWLVANSCEPLMPSVLSAAIRPAARLVMVRSAPADPMLTVETGLAPANV
ncbi:hypothetical protein D3C81_1600020 [compost metagenome]